MNQLIVRMRAGASSFKQLSRSRRNSGSALIVVLMVGFVLAILGFYMSTTHVAIKTKIEKSVVRGLANDVRGRFEGLQNEYENTESTRFIDILACADPCFQRCYFSDMNDANYPMPGAGWETAAFDDTNPNLPTALQGNCTNLVDTAAECWSCANMKDAAGNRGDFQPLKLPNPQNYSEEIAGFYTKDMVLCRDTPLNAGVTWPYQSVASSPWEERYIDWQDEDLVSKGSCPIMVTTFWRYPEGCQNMITENCGVEIIFDYRFFSPPDQVWRDLAP